MMMAWPTKPIGELCDLINGRAFKPSDWGTEGLPIVRIQNLNDQSKPFNKFDGKYSDKHFIDNGAILPSWSGTPGTSFGCFRWLRDNDRFEYMPIATVMRRVLTGYAVSFNHCHRRR